VLAGLGALLLSHVAAAYCIATTCDPKKQKCAVREPCEGKDCCVIEGEKLHWESRCLSFGVQENGSQLRHIPYGAADPIIRDAFGQWMKADCGGGKTPSFAMWDLGGSQGIVCDQPEFNVTKPNANVWIFRDDDWPYKDDGSTIAFTSTIYDKRTGALLDADVEINSLHMELTTTQVPRLVQKDLASIATHEAGHFLGMAHSTDHEATMYTYYTPGDLKYQSLEPDDEKGICELYPPDRDAPACTQPSPAHGFSRYCGNEPDDDRTTASCRMSAPRAEGRAGTLGTAAALVLTAAGRRRRRARER